MKDYIDKLIDEKQKFVEKHSQGISEEVINEVLEQIVVLEDMRRGLSETQILELLQLKNAIQVVNACRVIKMAS